MEYMVIVQSANFVWGTNFENAAEALSEKVNAAIADGWEPLGGLCSGETQSTKEPHLMQAMLRRR